MFSKGSATGLTAFLCLASSKAATPASYNVSDALDTVNYGAFLQSATFSIAEQLGVFTAYGLNVNFLQVPNSTYAYNEIVNGGYDVLDGLIDNAVNRRFDQGINLTVLAQLDGGTDVVLASVPSITSIQQLKGKSLLVDSPTSGYVYELRKVLSLYGLNYTNGDYSFTTVGGTNLRYAALVNGTYNGSVVYATTLAYPFTDYGLALPENQTMNILARYSEFLNPYAYDGLTVSEPVLSNSTAVDILTRFVAAQLTANRYLAASVSDTGYKTCVVKAITKQLNVTTSVAELEYTSAINTVSGELATPQLGNFTVDRIGLLNTIDIRNQLGGFANVSAGFDYADAIIPGPGKLIDYTVLEAAIKGMKTVNITC